MSEDQRSVRLGDVVDDYCSRCRLIMNHGVVSLVEGAVKKFGLDHPIMMDNDHAYWNALGNRYWPSFYVVDQRGVIAHRVIGEVHEGDPRANEIAEVIENLLKKG